MLNTDRRAMFSAMQDFADTIPEDERAEVEKYKLNERNATAYVDWTTSSRWVTQDNRARARKRREVECVLRCCVHGVNACAHGRTTGYSISFEPLDTTTSWRSSRHIKAGRIRLL
jgi:hypothetical protein